MHSLSDRCRSQRVPCACCYIYGMYKLEEKKRGEGSKGEMGTELVPVLRQAVNLSLEK